MSGTDNGDVTVDQTTVNDGTNVQTEDMDHGEKSRLGRRVSFIENKIDELMNRMDTQLSDIVSAMGERREPTVTTTTTTTEDDDDYIATEQDVRRVVKKMQEQDRVASAEYSKQYTDKFKTFKSNDAENYDAIWNEMYANFNEVITGNAEVDAEINYNKAARSVLSKKLAGKNTTTSVVKDDHVLPAGTSTTTMSDTPPERKITLSADAQEWASKFNLKSEDIQRALSKPE